jgi:ferritin-like metal-binding protein YciE
MRTQASSDELEKAFEHHRFETEGHVERLERVFRSVGARPMRGSSAAVAAIVTNGERLLGQPVDRALRDAWLIATARCIEHLEIATDGTVRGYAEECAADEKLTHLAERFVSPQSIRAARQH